MKTSYAFNSNTRVENVRIISASSSSIRIKFNRINGANYNICYKESSLSNYNCNLNSNNNDVIIKNLKSNTLYNIKVRASKGFNFSSFSNAISKRTYMNDGYYYSLNDGSKVDAPVISSNDEDLVFDGWYFDSTKKERYNFNDDVTEDITLYGKWVTSEGEDVIITPDTSSTIKIITIILGLVLIISAVHFIRKRYNINNRKK